MFEITDEFIVQAGFKGLGDEQKEQLKQRVTDKVQGRISVDITEQVGANSADELEVLIDGDDVELIQRVAEKDSPNYRESEDFLAIQSLGKENDASDEEILHQFAIISWFKQHQINIEKIVQDAMNTEMTELQTVLKMINSAFDKKQQ